MSHASCGRSRVLREALTVSPMKHTQPQGDMKIVLGMLFACAMCASTMAQTGE